MGLLYEGGVWASVRTTSPDALKAVIPEKSLNPPNRGEFHYVFPGIGIERLQIRVLNISFEDGQQDAAVMVEFVALRHNPSSMSRRVRLL